MTGLGRKLSYVLNNFVKPTPNESKKLNIQIKIAT